MRRQQHISCSVLEGAHCGNSCGSVRCLLPEREFKKWICQGGSSMTIMQNPLWVWVASVAEVLSLGEVFWPPDGSSAAVLPRREVTGDRIDPVIISYKDSLHGNGKLKVSCRTEALGLLLFRKLREVMVWLEKSYLWNGHPAAAAPVSWVHPGNKGSHCWWAANSAGES